MKRMIIAATESDMFYANFSGKDAEFVYFQIEDNLEPKLNNRRSSIRTEVVCVNKEYTESEISCDVQVWKGDDLIATHPFKFEAYDEYFDESDLDSHLARSINKFVDSIARR